MRAGALEQASVPLAATVVLLRESAQGAEVLLLERVDRGSFAGAWVFPGGSVDADDDDGSGDADAALRRAAVRETHEETGLHLEPHELLPLSRWHPPAEAPKRLLTSFFVAAAPAGAIALNPHEHTAWAWLRPADALAAHGRGTLRLFPPTWVTLHGLAGARTVTEALAALRAGAPAQFATRFGLGGRVVFWEGDVAYGDDALADAPGGRHRLEVGTLPWQYRRE
ncbi:NUDIX hydrolase [Rathayibacter sp. YIM 133350]|uniref:NUDIX hydrolase n=1 Tax=Rathayibacter sp. YIM 133350 TaxID=3131992 RepID=UPI00307EEA44